MSTITDANRISVYSVSDVNNIIKSLFNGCSTLKYIRIRGEISNYKLYQSGHHYFSIKDSDSVLSCVMFKNQAQSLRFRPDNGMSVIISGTVSVYLRDGKYQLICDRMEPDGAGQLQEAFEKLKQKLSEEKLFDADKKKQLPAFPNTIALVTSPSGAAVRDMIRILNSRWPLASVLIVPVTVQGDASAPEICEALSLINSEKLADLIIVGRGGGSLEDLWSFNEECVARAIFASDIPVISAVGHEPDVAISDYVADRRASTPSNAAEIAVPDISEVRMRLETKRGIISKSLIQTLNQNKYRYQFISSKECFSDPGRRIQYIRQDLDYFRMRLDHSTDIVLNNYKSRFNRLNASIAALNPDNTLRRGFSVAMINNRVITGVSQISEGDSVRLVLSDGNADCTVNTINRSGANNEN